MSGDGIQLAAHSRRVPGSRNAGVPALPAREASGPAATDSAPPPVSRKQQASVLASAFITITLTVGYNQCYGVFQEYYLSPGQTLLKPAPASLSSPPTALLAFVGTLGSGLTWAGSVAVSPLVSRIEHTESLSPAARASLSWWRRRLLAHISVRWVTISGVLLMSLGFALASFATKLWHLLLTQGLLYGVGSSMLYFPLLSPAPEYFTLHRATAMGVILAGGGVGGLAFSPLLRALLASLGAATTLRIWALVVLLVGIPVAIAVPRSRFPAMPPSSADSEDADRGPDAGRRLTHVPRSLLRKPTMLFSAAAAFCQAAGAVLPISFIPSYSVALGLDSSSGALLLAVSNAINAASRIATGYAGDRLGRQNALVMTAVLTMISVFALWFGSISSAHDGVSLLGAQAVWTSTAGILWVAFIVIYNLAAGGYYALFPATIAEVFGIRQYAAVNGFILVVRGLGTMLGSPVGGQLLRTSHGSSPIAPSYSTVVAWDGALVAFATVCFMGVRWADAQTKGWHWKA
ncbi:MFS general substrate transporter [Thozetella sp. PMI_491]|nr:MFS general substrate transporter [Thozetella sp. PMI_491]